MDEKRFLNNGSHSHEKSSLDIKRLLDLEKSYYHLWFWPHILPRLHSLCPFPKYFRDSKCFLDDSSFHFCKKEIFKELSEVPMPKLTTDTMLNAYNQNPRSIKRFLVP